MAKVRVYELAKELGVESKVILARLGDIGEFVRSASSTLEPPIVRRLKAEIGTPTRVAPADHDVDETAQVLGIDLQAFRNQKRGPASRTKSRREAHRYFAEWTNRREGSDSAVGEPLDRSEADARVA